MNRRKALQKTVQIAGASALTPTLLSLLQSCQQQAKLDWNPIILNSDQARLINTLVGTLLPQTETPGALELQVDRFIDLVIGKVYNAAAQQDILTKIDDLNQRCKNQMGKVFADLSVGDRAQFLRQEEKNSPKFNGQIWGTAVGEQEPVGVYRTLKSMALWGFFSSEAIGKNVLSYDPIPGAYLGCIPLEDVGNTWSL